MILTMIHGPIFYSRHAPADNRRIKLLYGQNMEYALIVMEVLSSSMRNMLQLNNQNGTFSEIGQMAGVSVPTGAGNLLCQFDNGGWKAFLSPMDIFVITLTVIS